MSILSHAQSAILCQQRLRSLLVVQVCWHGTVHTKGIENREQTWTVVQSGGREAKSLLVGGVHINLFCRSLVFSSRMNALALVQNTRSLHISDSKEQEQSTNISIAF